MPENQKKQQQYSLVNSLFSFLVSCEHVLVLTSWSPSPRSFPHAVFDLTGRFDQANKKNPSYTLKNTECHSLVFPKQTVCQHGSKERTKIAQHVECMIDCCSRIIVHLQHLRQVYDKNGYKKQKQHMHVKS